VELRKDDKKTRYTPVHLTEEMKARLLRMASTLSLSQSALIRRYISQGLDQDDGDLRAGRGIRYNTKTEEKRK
jgi:predicted DNA-binding protein